VEVFSKFGFKKVLDSNLWVYYEYNNGKKKKWILTKFLINDKIILSDKKSEHFTFKNRDEFENYWVKRLRDEKIKSILGEGI